MAKPLLSRKDAYDTTVTIDGINLKTFDTLTGGEIDSDELKYKPGAMAPEISLGGSVTVGQVVVGRLFQAADDALIDKLIPKVGKGKVVINKQPLDVDGNPSGRALVYTGVLKRITPPEVDSTSTDPAIIEFEVTPNGTVGTRP